MCSGGAGGGSSSELRPAHATRAFLSAQVHVHVGIVFWQLSRAMHLTCTNLLLLLGSPVCCLDAAVAANTCHSSNAGASMLPLAPLTSLSLKKLLAWRKQRVHTSTLHDVDCHAGNAVALHLQPCHMHATMTEAGSARPLVR